MENADIWSGIITIAFIVLDYASGVAAAAVRGDIASDKMRDGLYRKFGYIVILVLASLIDWGESYVPIGFDTPVFALTCAYIILIEITSIVENASTINPRLLDTKVLSVFERSNEQTLYKTEPDEI